MSQPPSWQRPQRPPFGGQQPPYYPAQPPYGQQWYGPGGDYPPLPKQGNGFAIAGIILAILVPLVGIIFSITGLVKSKARSGAGRTLSIVGIVVSVLVMGGTAAAIDVLAKSTAADPGCINAESAAGQMGSKLSADDAAMTRDQNNATARRTDLRKFLTDMNTLQGRWAAAEAQAQHQSVKAQIAALTADVSTISSSLQALERGHRRRISQIQSAVSKLQSDGPALDSLCSSL